MWHNSRVIKICKLTTMLKTQSFVLIHNEIHPPMFSGTLNANEVTSADCCTEYTLLRSRKPCLPTFSNIYKIGVTGYFKWYNFCMNLGNWVSILLRFVQYTAFISFPAEMWFTLVSSCTCGLISFPGSYAILKDQ